LLWLPDFTSRGNRNRATSSEPSPSS
jgi:hypothetical protein